MNDLSAIGALINGQLYASALLNQNNPCMRMQFHMDASDSRASVGIICHTVKFCDYYGFQYRNLKAEGNQPLLKIETDCTPQSSGQLRTRIEAFSETLGVKKTIMANRDHDTGYLHPYLINEGVKRGEGGGEALKRGVKSHEKSASSVEETLISVR